MRAIGTAALALEPQTAAHAEEMFVVLADPAIYEYENEPPPSADWLRKRFVRLESRQSPDGSEAWLNWVIRLPSSQLVGYVQATVRPDGSAAIAYVLSSPFWGRGLGRRAVEAMIGELVERYEVRTLSAVLKRENLRSLRLLERIGFALASRELHARHEVEAGEVLMLRETRPATAYASVVTSNRRLLAALPDFARDVEYGLLRIGRGDIVDQLREAEIERWTYDDFADAAYLYVRSPPPERSAGAGRAETVSVYDEVEINLETDEDGRLTRIEILLGARDIVARLEGR